MEKVVMETEGLFQYSSTSALSSCQSVAVFIPQAKERNLSCSHLDFCAMVKLTPSGAESKGKQDPWKIWVASCHVTESM